MLFICLDFVERFIHCSSLRSIKAHLPKPGTVFFDTSTVGIPVGLTTSENLGSVGIGGLFLTAVLVLFEKWIPLLIVLDGFE